MIKTFRALGLALAAFGLFACNQSEKPSGPALEGTGSARVKLPTVPVGYVPDSALDSSGHSVFLLSITGPDMNPILKSWDLYPGGAEKATITGIPVGWPRIFSGTLAWVTAWGDTVYTHEGSDSTAIYGDSIAQVSLFLRKFGSSGSAEVCVEVEGWASDTSCVKPPRAMDLNGCWMISVGDSQTTRYGSLFIRQQDTSVFMVITWKTGEKDSSMGTLFHDVLYMGQLYGMPGFHLKGSVVDSGSRIVASYRGDSDSLYQQLQALRGPCDTSVVPPSFPPDSLSGCFQVAQSVYGKTLQGGLRLVASQGSAYGTLVWSGLDPMTVYGYFKGSQDSAFLQLTGTAPSGMLDSAGSPADTVQYRSTITVSPYNNFQGNVFRLLPGGWERIGIWKASPGGCPADTSRRQ